MYLCQLLKPDGTKKWEEVDAYIYTNWRKALTKTGEQRYNGNRACLVEGQLSFHGTFSVADFACLARMLGIQVNNQAIGYHAKPEYVKFQRKKGVHIHENKAA